MRPIATDKVSWSVCLCVGLSVDQVRELCKNGWTSTRRLGNWLRLAQGTVYLGLDGGRHPTERGNFWCCPPATKALGVSTVVYAAKRIIQSLTTTRHAMRSFVKLLFDHLFFYYMDCLQGLMPAPFLLSLSVFVFSFFLNFLFLCRALD